jgi:hypothetical protein
MHVHEKYRLGPRLGVGGMADVFRAELMGAEGFSRPVAIKRLHAAVSSDPAFCAMFVREARLLSALHHTNIVSVLDFEWDGDGRLFLVLELVDGVNLAELVRRGPLSLAVAEHVMGEVLRGLGHAHARGILHRDVTPHNVLLSFTGEVKLSDFGLAQASSSSRVSDGGLIRGKVPYLSPEQLQGLTIDARSDLFSLGVMSYQLLTGRYPFVGRTDQATMAESIARMLTATIVPPRDLRPELSPELSDVVMRLLERERDRRFLSADMVLADMHVPARGRELLIDLLAERFPGGVADGAGAGSVTGPGAAAHAGARTGAARASGDAFDPWLRRHTASLHGLQARPGHPGRHGHARTSSRRWWPGLALVILVLPLAWVIALQWPRGTIRAPAGEAGERIEPAASRPGAVDAERADAPPAGNTPVATGATGIAAPGTGRGAGPAAILASPETPGTLAQPRPSRSSDAGAAADRSSSDRTSGHTGGHAGSRAGRTLPRRDPQRMQAAAATAGTNHGTQAGKPRPAPSATKPAAGPATQGATEPTPDMDMAKDMARPAERRYEPGWTELAPQPTLTGEVPIKRRELP